MAEEGGAVARVVDRAEHAGRGDRRRRGELVQVAELGGDAVAPRLLDHLRARVDPEVFEAREERGERAVTTGEVEHAVAGLEPRPERDDELGAVAQVGGGVGVLATPALGAGGVLRLDPFGVLHRNVSNRSGCLRRKRSIARACQIVCRERKVWSITAA